MTARDAVSNDPSGRLDRASAPSQDHAENSSERYRRLLKDLRTNALEPTWGDIRKVSGLLRDAGLDPDHYPLEGSGSTLWANLIPVLRNRAELGEVLDAVEGHVGGAWGETAAELANFFKEERRKLAASIDYDRMRTRLLENIESALALLRKAPNYHTALLMPDHPNPARIAGMRSWIVGCVKAVSAAQQSRAQLSFEDEDARLEEIAAQLEEIATQLASVSGAFRLYASSLERFRSTEETGPGRSVRSLAAVAEDERLLLEWRADLRTSIQRLVAALRTDS